MLLSFESLLSIVTSMDLGPEKLGEMIHPNLVVQGFTFIFGHFVSNTAFLNVHPTPSDFVINL
jgi:hypothetical protein